MGRKAVSSAELNVLDAATQLYLGDAIAATESIDSAQAVLACGSKRDTPAGAAPRRGHKRWRRSRWAVPALHRRELQILQVVEQGLRNREIGQRLDISEETVKWYLKRVYEALGVNNRAHALARVRQLKLLGST